MRLLRWMVAGVAVIVLIYQSASLLWTAGSDLYRLTGVIDQTALWRGAYFHQNRRVADYLQFLAEVIPPSGRVVLPPSGQGPRLLTVTPFMQFFLAPRPVLNCTDLDCLVSIDRQGTYIVFLSVSQAHAAGPQPEAILPFDGQWGVVLPPGADTPVTSEITPWPGAIQSGFALFGALLWIVCLALGGWGIQQTLRLDWPPLVQAALGGSLGWGLFSLAAAVAASFGVLLSVPLVLILTILVGGLGCAAAWHHGAIVWRKMRVRPDGWHMFFTGLGSIAMLQAVGKGFSSIDAIQIWGAKGYGLAVVGSLSAAVTYGTNTLPYPLHMPLLIAASRLLGLEGLPASKAFFPLYYISALLLLDWVLQRLGLRRNFAGLAAALFGTAPLVFQHASLGYANLPLAATLLAAGLVLWLGVESPAPGDSRLRLVWGGVLLALAAWTRTEGLWLAWSGLAALAVFARHARRRLLFAAAPLAVYTLFWSFLQVQVYAPFGVTNDLPGQAASQILAGNLHVSELGYVLRAMLASLVDVRIWGFWGWLLAAACLLAFGGWRHRSWAALGWWAVGLLQAGLIVGIYYLTSFDTVRDVSWWVNTGLDRMLFPALLFLWLGGAGLLHLLDDRQDSAGTGDLK